MRHLRYLSNLTAKGSPIVNGILEAGLVASWFETPAFALPGCGGLLTMRV
jgi:hypothetical protein